MNKLLILIMNSDLYPSNTIIPFIKKTYMKKEYAESTISKYQWPKFKDSSNKNSLESPIIIFQAGSNKESFKNNVLYLNISKHIKTQAERNIKTFEWALENLEFDFIYRTTTTAYINLEKIYQNIQNQKAENYYSAPEVRHREIKFGSGAGYFLSKDLVKLVVDNKNNWDYSLLDDVALGKLLNSLDKKLTPNLRQDFKKYPSFNEIDLNQFHYRFRIDLYGYPRFLEILILLSIHRKIKYMKNEGIIARYIINIFDILNKILFSICKLFNFVYIYKAFKKRLKSYLKSLLS